MEWFRQVAKLAAAPMGGPTAFLLGCGLDAVWAGGCFLLGFSDTWQLTIDTSLGTVTFLAVFLIQYARKRDTRAIRLKLDELLRATRGERPTMIDLDRLSADEIAHFEDELRRWHAQHPVATPRPRHPKTYRTGCPRRRI